MALVLKDRVLETSVTTGTGTITLDGAVVDYQGFTSAIGAGNTTYYTITHDTFGEWEVGIGTVGTNTLTRDTILSSSNGGSAVNFTAGSKNVFCDYPASKAVYANASGQIHVDSNSYIDFESAPSTTVAAGRMWYNNTLGNWNLGMGGGNITQQVGEELFIYGKASAAITDSPLQIIYHTGTVGASGVVTFAPTVAGITDVNAILGVATENISLNGFGRITSYGVIHGINTTGSAFGETWADDDVIWYNPVTGNPTKVKPVAPNMKVQIGLVISAGSGGSGSFQVLLQAGTQLGGTDSNVQITSPTNGNILTYDGGNGYWKNTALTAGSGITVTPSANGVLTVAATGGGTGTVTSVGLTAPSIFTVSGSPVTSSGTLALTYSGTALPIANGGTNSTATPTAGGAVYGTGTAYAITAAGTSGAVLTSNGASAPTWSTTAGVNQSDVGTAPNQIPLNQYLGSMAYQDENSVKINGGTATLSTVTATASTTGSTTSGAISYGTLSYSDTGHLASFATGVDSYAQVEVQNTNATSNASSDIIVANNNTTASTFYGSLGMNSSAWTGTAGTTSLNAPNMVYLTSTSADLTIGTTTSNAIRFVTNGGADKLIFDASGNVGIGLVPTGLDLLELGAGTITKAPLGFTSGSLLTTSDPGSVEYDGTALYFTPTGTSRALTNTSYYYRKNTATTLASATGNQAIFALTNGATVAANTTYEIECEFQLSTSGTVSHTEAFGFTLATATVTNMGVAVNRLAGNTTSTALGAYLTSVTPVVVTGALTTAQVGIYRVKGTIAFGTGGSINPVVAFSAAPGGTSTIVLGSWMKLTPIGATGSNVSIGTWA